VQEQDATIAKQEKELKTLAAAVKAQAALIRSVSDRLELGKCAPQVVAYNR
jgi:hypothetical protein